MTVYDLLLLDERFRDRLYCGDEFAADRSMRAALQLAELAAVNLDSLSNDMEDDGADATNH